MKVRNCKKRSFSKTKVKIYKLGGQKISISKKSDSL